MSLTRFRFHRWSRNRWHVYLISVPFLRCGGTHERGRKPVFSFWSATQECNMCFLLIPSFIPQKRRRKRNACSLLSTSYNVVAKQFILKICIKCNFLNRSIENRDPLHRRSARRKTNSISDIAIQKFLITRSISLKKNLIQLHLKKKANKKR